MPWCPKCRNEYVNGITTCTDCGCALVDSLDEILRVQLASGEETDMAALQDFLKCSGITDANLERIKEDEQFCIMVSEAELPRARRVMEVFARQWAAEKAREKEAEAACGDTVRGGKPERETAVYEEAASKAENFRSGGYTLLAAGVVGLILLGCVITGVLPLRLSGPGGILSGCVMGAVFAVFAVLGFHSLRMSKTFEGRAREETELTEELHRWCRQNLSAVKIDEAAGVLPAEEEIRYFRRTECMKELISRNFLNLEPGYLDHFVDEIYPEFYDGNK